VAVARPLASASTSADQWHSPIALCHCAAQQPAALTDLVPFKAGLTPRPYDVERLIEHWQEGRSPHTVRAYGRDLAHFARWSGAAAPGEAITRLLTGSMGD
jgi:hypothetical protein